MKATLILVAIALALVLSLAMSRAMAEEPRFSFQDRSTLLFDFPGGVFENEWTYRRCENGYWMRYLASGQRVDRGSMCWK